MDPAGPGRRKTATEAPRVLCIRARHEGRRLLVPHLYKTNIVLSLSEGFDDAVEPVAGHSKDRVDAPAEHPLDQQVRRIHRHKLNLVESIHIAPPDGPQICIKDYCLIASALLFI